MEEGLEQGYTYLVDRYAFSGVAYTVAKVIIDLSSQSKWEFHSTLEKNEFLTESQWNSKGSGLRLVHGTGQRSFGARHGALLGLAPVRCLTTSRLWPREVRKLGLSNQSPQCLLGLEREVQLWTLGLAGCPGKIHSTSPSRDSGTCFKSCWIY